MRSACWFVMVGAAACGGKADDAGSKGSGSAVGSASAQPALELVRCTAAPAPPGISHAGMGTGFSRGVGGGGRIGGSPGKLAKGRLALGATHAIGPIEAAIVRRYLKRAEPELQHCYDTTVGGKPDGEVYATFAIDAAGKVTAAKASGVDDKLSDCIAGAIGKLEFPAASGGGHVEANAAFQLTHAPISGFGPLPIHGAPRAPAPVPASTAAKVDRTTKILDTIDHKKLTDALDKLTFEPMAEPLPLQWTPFAQVSVVKASPDDAAIEAAVAGVVKTKLADLDRCFAGDRAAVGSMRALIAPGSPVGVRVGGLGDAKIERCVADALRTAAFAAPAQPHEVACDLVRGADRPWRLALDGDYQVVDASQPAPAKVAGDRIAAIVVPASAPAKMIGDAIDATAEAPLALIAIRGDGPPQLVAAAPAEDGVFGPSPLELSVGSDGAAHACLHGVDLADAAIAKAEHDWCRPACAVRVALGDTVGAERLAAFAVEARAAGLAGIGVTRNRSCGR